jgi:predicted transcriptional regulator
LAVDNSNRTRVKLLVSLLPGVHLRQLQRIIGLSFNSTRYHVDALAKTGEIVRAEEGGYSRLYPVGTTDADRALYPLTRNDSDQRILNCLSENRMNSHKQLCEATGLAKSTITEHLAHLVEIGVAKIYQDGSTTLYGLNDPDKVRQILEVSSSTLLRKATREFIDLWDF